MVMQAKPLLWQTLSLTDRKINYKLTCINDSATKHRRCHGPARRCGMKQAGSLTLRSRRTPMSHPLFLQHQAILDQALQALRERQYWSPHPEMPSPKSYGESAPADGLTAFEALLQQDFQLDGLPPSQGWVGSERSPYRGALRIRYPRHDADALLSASAAALQSWRQAGPHAWVSAWKSSSA